MPVRKFARSAVRVVKAKIHGGPQNPEIEGTVVFKKVRGGTKVIVEVSGLPGYQPATNGAPIGPHGFHIHEFGVCEIGDINDPFVSAGDHWNPFDEPHGNHAGDFPVLFSNNGIAQMTFFTNKFDPQDVVGRSVLIHLHPDDYRSQPSGESGTRIACGVIENYYMRRKLRNKRK